MEKKMEKKVEKYQGSIQEVQPAELAVHIGEMVVVHGSIYKIRKMSGFCFVMLRTARHMIQTVCDNKELMETLAEEACVKLTAEVVEEKRAKAGVELHIAAVEYLSVPSAQMPIVINQKLVDTSLENKLDFRPLTLRNEKERAVFRIQEGIVRGFRKFLEKEHFVEIHTPKIVSEGAEGGANIFRLDYFGREAYLAQSPQFYKQMMVGVFERVYEVGPVFRAEKHDTARHLNEYTSVDFEMGYIESFYDIMAMEVGMIGSALALLMEEYDDELSLLGITLPKILSGEKCPIKIGNAEEAEGTERTERLEGAKPAEKAKNEANAKNPKKGEESQKEAAEKAKKWEESERAKKCEGTVEEREISHVAKCAEKAGDVQKVENIMGIPVLKFTEAKRRVAETFGRQPKECHDFEPEEEKLLSELVKHRFGSEFVFITHYPSEKRPFYVMEDADNPGETLSFDLIFRGLEITTGGQRIHEYEMQLAKMKERGMDVSCFESYLMMHRHGMPPHGGLGLGLERFTAKLLGFENVRQASLFPRDIHRLAP